MTAASAKDGESQSRPRKGEASAANGQLPAPGVKVLIVEDDVAVRKGLDVAIRELGCQTKCVGTAGEAMRAIEDFQPEVLVVDVHLPDGDGIEVFRAASESNPDRDGVVITGQASLDSAVEALRAGIADYLLKPLRPAQLEVVFQRLNAKRRLESEVETLRAELQETGKLGELIGRSEPMRKIFEVIRRVARSNAPILITGASGTGKEVVARTLHRLSRRSSAPFVAFNCGAISPTLIESELFGHERGSFTGADKRRLGYFEEANGGTLFLDEITEMGPELQVKLLRVLEARTLRRVGGNQDLRVDVRLVSATNRDPREAIRDGKLREDLYYRLNVFPIALPTLAERREDIPLLAEYFRRQIEDQEKAGVAAWSPEALQMLDSYDWPGNVRELRNVVHRAYVMTEGETIQPEVLESLLPQRREKPAKGTAKASASKGDRKSSGTRKR
ncbi:MAG TPA: sigma-54 dependent transcriptional regulator [Thermoanaerobaculia bacterium]|jgi:DNA-binding NtrC family response regulator